MSTEVENQDLVSELGKARPWKAGDLGASTSRLRRGGKATECGDGTAKDTDKGNGRGTSVISCFGMSFFRLAWR